MIDIEKLELLPSKVNRKMAHEGNLTSRYYRSWQKITRGLSKVKLDKWVGKHVDDLVSHYVGRMRQYDGRRYDGNRVNYLLYQIFGMERVEKGHDDRLYVVDYWGRWYPIAKYRKYYRWRNNYFFVHPDTGLICKFKREGQPIALRKKRKVWREQAEKDKALAKSRREDAKLKEIKKEDLIDWIFQERKRKEKALNDQKMIAKGFDPITSFRNVPRAA